MSQVPNIMLRDGTDIPQLGLGVFQVPPEETEANVRTALEIGYRHIDTAQGYRNEAGVGAAVRSSGIDRSEIFVTSKLNNGAHEPADALAAFEATLQAMRFDYLDLFLIHWPLPTLYGGDFVSTWKVLIKLHREGRIRSVGVSNFQVAHLERLAAESDLVPSVNQIEVHPYFNNTAVRTYGAEHGIVTEAWAPIAQGKVLDDPVVVEVAQETGKTPAQVVLRWHVQRGDVVFPKSVTPSRLAENFAIFDFELDDSQMQRITSLDRGEAGRNGPNPDTFAMLPPPRS